MEIFQNDQNGPLLLDQMQQVIRSEMQKLLHFQQMSATLALESMVQERNNNNVHNTNNAAVPPRSSRRNSSRTVQGSPRYIARLYSQNGPVSSHFSEDFTDVTVTELPSDEKSFPVIPPPPPHSSAAVAAATQQNSNHHFPTYQNQMKHIFPFSQNQNQPIQQEQQQQPFSSYSNPIRVIDGLPLLTLNLRDHSHSQHHPHQHPAPLLKMKPSTHQQPTYHGNNYSTKVSSLPPNDKIIDNFCQRFKTEMSPQLAQLPLLKLHWPTTNRQQQQQLSKKMEKKNSIPQYSDNTADDVTEPISSTIEPANYSAKLKVVKSPSSSPTPIVKSIETIDKQTTYQTDAACQWDYLTDDDDDDNDESDSQFHFHSGFALKRKKKKSDDLPVYFKSSPEKSTMTEIQREKTMSAETQTLELSPNKDSEVPAVRLRLSKAPIISPEFLSQLQFEQGDKENKFLSVVSVDDELWHTMVGKNMPNLQDEEKKQGGIISEIPNGTVAEDDISQQRRRGQQQQQRMKKRNNDEESIFQQQGPDEVTMKLFHSSYPLLPPPEDDDDAIGPPKTVKEDVVRTLRAMDYRLQEIMNLSNRIESDYSSSRRNLSLVNRNLVNEMIIPRYEAAPPAHEDVETQVQTQRSIAKVDEATMTISPRKKEETKETPRNFPIFTPVRDNNVEDTINQAAFTTTPRNDDEDLESIFESASQVRMNHHYRRRASSSILNEPPSFVEQLELNNKQFQSTFKVKSSSNSLPGRHDPEELRQWTEKKRQERLANYRDSRNERIQAEAHPFKDKMVSSTSLRQSGGGGGHKIVNPPPHQQNYAAHHDCLGQESNPNRISSARSLQSLAAAGHQIPANIKLQMKREQERQERNSKLKEMSRYEAHDLAVESLQYANVPKQKHELHPVHLIKTPTSTEMMKQSIRAEQARQANATRAVKSARFQSAEPMKYSNEWTEGDYRDNSSYILLKDQHLMKMRPDSQLTQDNFDGDDSAWSVPSDVKRILYANGDTSQVDGGSSITQTASVLSYIDWDQVNQILNTD